MSSEADSQSGGYVDGEWRKVRQAVLERDGYECRFCGMENEDHKEENSAGLDVHHIIPRSDGGNDSMRNLVALCRSCHRTMESLHGQAMGELNDTGLSEERVFALRRELEDAVGECRYIYETILPRLSATPRIEDRRVDSRGLKYPCDATIHEDRYTDMEKSMFLMGFLEGMTRVGTHVEAIVDGEIDYDGVEFDEKYNAPLGSFWTADDEEDPDFHNDSWGW